MRTGPFTHEVTQLLRLRNPTNDPIAFKVSSVHVSVFALVNSHRGLQVKTTAPKQ